MSQIIPSSSGPLASISHNELQTLLNKALELPIKQNPYTSQITRSEPTAIVFLVDQSGSMGSEMEFRGEAMQKSEAVALIINELFDTLISRCKKSEGVRDYFDVALIGYGGRNDEEANLLWEGELEGREFVKISELDQNFLEEQEINVEQLIRGQIKKTTRKIKTWINPIANGLTPMNYALQLAGDLLEKWIAASYGKDQFPPLIFNITDGEATDGGDDDSILLNSAERIKNLHTTDGYVLLINIHLSEENEKSIIFPSSFKELPVDYNAEVLYNMSSEMPKTFCQQIAQMKKTDCMSKYIGMAYNADMAGLLQILTIGTNTAFNQTSLI